MKSKFLITGLILVIVVGIYFLFDSYVNNNNTELKYNSMEKDKNNIVDFMPLSSNELSLMLKQKDFKLIDVHIPEQRHIPGTDYFIPFNDIDGIMSVFSDKNEKIVLYCRSGSMSKTAAKELIKNGYTNVFDLTNGLNEWTEQDRETLPKKSIPGI